MSVDEDDVNEGTFTKQISSFERAQVVEKWLRDPQFKANLDCLMDALTSIIYSRRYMRLFSTLVPQCSPDPVTVPCRAISPATKHSAMTVCSETCTENANHYQHWQQVRDAMCLLNSYRVNRQDFDFVDFIGKGAFGKVFLVRHKESSELYAMKILSKTLMLRKASSALFWAERDIMAFTSSEWIVRLYYAFQDQKSLYIVMEFVPGGDLVNIMTNNELSEQSVKFYVAEIVLAVDAVHSFGYVHRDVKPDNMLIDARGHIKLADFGTAAKVDVNGGLVDSVVAVGTPDYISPEILQSQSNATPYGLETDWWSVGVLTYELLVGETPFYADSLVGTYSKIMNHEKHLKFPESLVTISEQAKEFIRAFLRDKSSRLGKQGVEVIRQHPFFDDVSWSWDNIRDATPPIVPDLSCPEDTSYFQRQTHEDSIASKTSGLNIVNDLEEGGGGKRSSSSLANSEFDLGCCYSSAFVGFSFSNEFRTPKQQQLHGTCRQLNASHSEMIREKEDEGDKIESNELKSRVSELERLYEQMREQYAEKCNECTALIQQIEKLNDDSVEVVKDRSDSQHSNGDYLSLKSVSTIEDDSNDSKMDALSFEIGPEKTECVEMSSPPFERFKIPTSNPEILPICASGHLVDQNVIVCSSSTLDKHLNALYDSQVESLTCELNNVCEENKRFQADTSIEKSIRTTHNKLNQDRNIATNRLREVHLRENALISKLNETRDKYDELVQTHEHTNEQVNALRAEKEHLENLIKRLRHECNYREISMIRIQQDMTAIRRKYREQQLMNTAAFSTLNRLLGNQSEIAQKHSNSAQQQITLSCSTGNDSYLRSLSLEMARGVNNLNKNQNSSTEDSKSENELTPDRTNVAVGRGGHSQIGRMHRLEQKCKKLERLLDIERFIWEKERQNLEEKVQKHAMIVGNRDGSPAANPVSSPQRQRMSTDGSSTQSVISFGNLSSPTMVNGHCDAVLLEAWLQIPSKRNIKRNGWKKQYVVLYRHKIVFYANQKDFLSAGQPLQKISVNNLYHVRAIKQCDLLGIESWLIPRIFQLIYDTTCALTKGERKFMATSSASCAAASGERVNSTEESVNKSSCRDRKSIISVCSPPRALKSDGTCEHCSSLLKSNAGSSKAETILQLQHNFVSVPYRNSPANCDICGKSFYHLFTPPHVVECTRCHIKSHKSHLTDQTISYKFGTCPVTNTNTTAAANAQQSSAKILFVLCSTSTQQATWITTILAQIEARKLAQTVTSAC